MGFCSETERFLVPSGKGRGAKEAGFWTQTDRVSVLSVAVREAMEVGFWSQTDRFPVQNGQAGELRGGVLAAD